MRGNPRIIYRIMSFNIRQFSDNSAFHKKGVDSKKDLDTIAKIVNDNNIDIIAIQEIRGKIAFKELISAIAYGYSKDVTFKTLEQPSTDDNKTLKSVLMGDDYLACYAGKWQGRWTHPNSKWGSAISEEGYAFIWNTDKFELPTNERGDVQPVIKHKKEAYFVRPPFYGRFRTKTKPPFEIRLLNTHILYTKNAQYKKLKDIDSDIDVELLNSPNDIEREQTEIALGKQGFTPLDISVLKDTLNKSDVQRRRNEVKNLITEVLTREEDKNGYGSYVFMLGDYNLNLSNSTKPYKNRVATIDPIVIYGADSKNDYKEYIITQGKLTSLRVPPKDDNSHLNIKNNSDVLANNYDHFTYNVNMDKYEFGGRKGRDIYIGEPIVVNILDKMNNIREYFDRVSDHLPIYIEIGF